MREPDNGLLGMANIRPYVSRSAAVYWPYVGRIYKPYLIAHYPREPSHNNSHDVQVDMKLTQLSDSWKELGHNMSLREQRIKQMLQLLNQFEESYNDLDSWLQDKVFDLFSVKIWFSRLYLEVLFK